MDFARTTLRDERRRRVLIEERAAEGDSADGAKSAGGDAPTAPRPGYTEGARREQQPRVVDLLPRRPFTLAVLLLGLTTVAAGLATLHVYRPALRNVLGGPVECFDVGAAGTLRGWLAALLYALAAAGAGLIYSLRQHKSDDYRGRYRIWFWATPLLLLASAEASAGLSRPLGRLLAGAVTAPSSGAANAAAVLVVLLAAGAVQVRLGVEVRRCRLSLSLLGASAASLLAAGLLSLRPGLGGDPELAGLLAGAASLLTATAVLGTTLSYGRRVLREVEGLAAPATVRRRERRAARRTAPAPDAAATGKVGAARGRAKSASEPPVADAPASKDSAPAKPEAKAAPAPKPAQAPPRSEPAAKPAAPASSAPAAGSKPSGGFAPTPQPKPAAPSARPQLASHTQDADDDEDDEDAGDSAGGLSKAERRRLKKMERRQQRKAA